MTNCGIVVTKNVTWRLTEIAFRLEEHEEFICYDVRILLFPRIEGVLFLAQPPHPPFGHLLPVGEGWLAEFWGSLILTTP